MKKIELKHKTSIIVGDYQFADFLNHEVIEQLKYAENIGHTNVKASKHTYPNWLPQNQEFNKFKSYIINETKKYFAHDEKYMNGNANFEFTNFWANVYLKGDHAIKHAHKPSQFSIVYFAKSKWYDSPLIFTDSGKKIRPKEGRYIIFPAYLFHRVPKHRYEHSRITLAGNIHVIQ